MAANVLDCSPAVVRGDGISVDAWLLTQFAAWSRDKHLSVRTRANWGAEALSLAVEVIGAGLGAGTARQRRPGAQAGQVEGKGKPAKRGGMC